MPEFPSRPSWGSWLSEAFLNSCHSSFDLTPFNFQREKLATLPLTSSWPQSQGKGIIRTGPKTLVGKRCYFIKGKTFLSFPQAVFLAVVRLPIEAPAPPELTCFAYFLPCVP